jgi:hypothetical protein
LEAVIKARIPSILSNIAKNIDELENEMNQLGRPVAVDAGVSYWLVLEGENSTWDVPLHGREDYCLDVGYFQTASFFCEILQLLNVYLAGSAVYNTGDLQKI